MTSLMQVWKAKSLLLSIGEEGLNAYHIPAIKLASQASRSRGVHRFLLDEERGMLCIAIKKRLMLFSHSSNEFVELKDFSLPDMAVALQWVGDSICVGFKRECAPMPSVCPALPHCCPISSSLVKPNMGS